MKWIYTLIILFVLSSCSTQQKYSNSRYQKNNNVDDAYFSPDDVKYTSTTNSNSTSTRYNVEDKDYYVNTQSETANPNAGNRSQNYTQYTPSNGENAVNNQTFGNSNALQLQTPQRTTINNFYQPNWGNNFMASPFSPWGQPGMNVNINNFNNRWGWSVGVGNNMGNGWMFNPWTNSWVYDPWRSSFMFTPRVGQGNFVYDPWTNNFVYDPWGFNNAWANPWNNPWNNPWAWNNPYNNFGWNNNTWCPTLIGNGYNNQVPTTYVRNTRRRPTNNFMPAVRRTRTETNTGGTRIIGSTEMQAPSATPARNTRTAPGTVNGTTPTVNNTTPTPTRRQTNYRTYTTPSQQGSSNYNAAPSQNSFRNNTGTNTNYNRNAPSNGVNRTTPNTQNRSYYSPRNSNTRYRSTPTNTRTAPTRTAPTRSRTVPRSNYTPPRTTPSRSGSSNRSSGSSGGSRRRR